MTTLNQTALDTLKAYGIDPELYIDRWSTSTAGEWAGDACGCIDDRCIGHHHAGADDCGCLEPCIDLYIDDLPPLAFEERLDELFFVASPDHRDSVWSVLAVAELATDLEVGL